MTDHLVTSRDDQKRRERAPSTDPQADPRADLPSALPEPYLQFDPPREPTAQADRRNARLKLAAGWRGLKAAVRGDSSFFAHGYRGTLIAITAALLGVNQWGWCFLFLGACLVLTAELTHSAVDTLARAVGDPEEPRLKTARDIAAASVLLAAFASGAVTLIVLSAKFVELVSWHP
jgi:diacylglycerol kinase (ATP)